MADDQTGTKKKTLNWNFKPTKDWETDWVGYFNEYSEQLTARVAQETEKVDKSSQILVSGHEASGADPIAPQNFDWADLLHNNGWEYKIGYSQYFKPAYNVRSRDKVIDRSYIQAVKRGRPRIHLVYERADGESSWKMDNFVVTDRPGLSLQAELKEVIEDV